MDELTIKRMEMLEKKPRKQAHSEYSTAPVTGLRNTKGTYSGLVSKRKKEVSVECETSELDDTAWTNNLDCTYRLDWFNLIKFIQQGTIDTEMSKS